ncbi:MAG: hypothetical protein J6M02_00790 [Clostridia bacterium]|nr:hypothetical protein [Clostridia bacterium]
MAELNLSEDLKFRLGEETVSKLTALKELGGKVTDLFAESKDIPNQMLISISRKSRKLNQFLLRVNEIDGKTVNNDGEANNKKVSEMREAMKQWLGGDIDKFSKDLESEIKSVKVAMDEKAKAIATQLNEETQEVAESADHRIAEDIDLVKQQKQELFEARAKLMQKIKEVDERYNKALVQYDQKRNFFANFREARSKVDEKTGKKQGIFASIKAAFTSTKDSKAEEVDRQRRDELDQITDERTKIENEIAACDAKIVALSDQRKNVKQEILKEHSIIADALKAHLDAAKNYKGQYNEHQVTLNEREAKYMELLSQEHLDGKSEELTAQIESAEAEIMQLRNQMLQAQIGVTAEERSGNPTVENILGEADKKIAELDEKAGKMESYSEKMKIQKEIYGLEEQQRDIMDPIVADEYEQLYGKPEEEEAEVEKEPETQPEEEKKENKNVPGYKELNARYKNDREGMLYVVNLKIDELKEKMHNNPSLEERKEIMAELDKLYEKQKEYERPLTRREAYRKAKEHYDMDR